MELHKNYRTLIVFLFVFNSVWHSSGDEIKPCYIKSEDEDKQKEASLQCIQQLKPKIGSKYPDAKTAEKLLQAFMTDILKDGDSPTEDHVSHYPNKTRIVFFSCVVIVVDVSCISCRFTVFHAMLVCKTGIRKSEELKSLPYWFWYIDYIIHTLEIVLFAFQITANNELDRSVVFGSMKRTNATEAFQKEVIAMWSACADQIGKIPIMTLILLLHNLWISNNKTSFPECYLILIVLICRWGIKAWRRV